MNNFIMMTTAHPLIGIILNGIIVANTAAAELTSVNDSPFAGQLYIQIGNELPPPQSEMDANPEIRKQICLDITNSSYFSLKRKDPVDMNRRKTYKKLKHKEKYQRIFKEIYERSRRRRVYFRRKRKYVYVNPYRVQTVRVEGVIDGHFLSNIPRQEHAFVCLIKNRISKIKDAYYVSKEYNVGPDQAHPVPGRFVFKPPSAGIQLVILAEEPAKVHEAPDFNLELYYLQLRRDHEPEENQENDPLCQMIPKILPYNQNHRLCSSVLGSSHFKDKVVYLSKVQRRDECYYEEVFFHTDDAKREAARSGKYHEWMVYCRGQTVDNNAEAHFYISRAYKSNQVFLYRLLPPNYHAYLENLSTNISIADDITVELS